MRIPEYYEGNEIFFDTHAHLYDDRYAEENESTEDILARAAKAGVRRVLVPADCECTSARAIDICREYNAFSGVELFCSVGVHPHESESYGDNTEKYLSRCLSDRNNLRIKALGEIGLDYFYNLSPKDCQKEVFVKQLELAFDADIPVIIHAREATKDCLDILKRFYKEGRLRKTPGVCHCCTMSAESASEMVKMGFYIGIDGPVTFKNNRKTPELVRSVPVERIVIETDSPYLTPEPNRGIANEPCFVPFVARTIAQKLDVATEEIARITYENANRLYEIEEAK